MQKVLFVVFGATGDLSQRKLMPALVALYQKKQLPERFDIIGFGRKELTQEQFKSLFSGLPEDFAKHLVYVKGDYDAPDGYQRLAEQARGFENILFYLTTPPEVYGSIVAQLAASGLSDGTSGWRRVVIEKPFGSDLASAKELNSVLHSVFKEEQVFRIDHYLAKETVRKMPSIQAQEGIRWNKDHVDHIQITASEDFGIGGRGGFYDQTGALRDMVQSHLLQILSLIAMDAYGNKSSVLRDLVVPGEKDVVRGQYEGYLHEQGIPQASSTETFVALKTGVANERWQGVPFYIRTGKQMAARYAEVVIFYKDKSGIVMPINPRPGMPKPNTPEGHEVLLAKILQGDRRLFPSADEIELQWRFIDKIRAQWSSTQLHQYPAGSTGPEEADELIRRSSNAWLN